MAGSVNEILILRPEKDESDDDNALVWSRSERQRWLLQMTLGTCMLYASRVVVPLVMPIMAKEQHWTKMEAGAVLSTFFRGFMVTQVLGGYLSDRLGGERILLYAGVGWSLATLAIPVVTRCFHHPAHQALVILREFHGACQGFHYPALSSLSSRRLSEHERGPFFSVATAGTAVGVIIAGTVGSSLVAAHGWPAIFYFIGGCGVLWTASLALTIKSSTQHRNMIALPSKLWNPSDVTDTPMLQPHPWLAVVKTSAFWSCSLAHACQNNCFFIMMSWLPTYFHDNFPQGKDWVFNIVPWVFLMPSILIGREFSDWLLSKNYSITNTRKIVESICLLTQALGLLIIANSSNFMTAVFCTTLVIAASGFHNNAVIINPQDLAPSHAGSVFGLMNMIGAIPGFLGVHLTGYILEVTQSWPDVFIFTACINIVGAIAYVMYGSATRIV